MRCSSGMVLVVGVVGVGGKDSLVGASVFCQKVRDWCEWRWVRRAVLYVHYAATSLSLPCCFALRVVAPCTLLICLASFVIHRRRIREEKGGSTCKALRGAGSNVGKV